MESPVHSGLEETIVTSLKDMDRNEWDYDILHDLFTERDMHLISQIPSSMTIIEDCWQWFLEEKSDYSIKSGYRFLTSYPLSYPTDLSQAFWDGI